MPCFLKGFSHPDNHYDPSHPQKTSIECDKYNLKESDLHFARNNFKGFDQTHFPKANQLANILGGIMFWLSLELFNTFSYI